jgi:hypothetical protein
MTSNTFVKGFAADLLLRGACYVGAASMQHNLNAKDGLEGIRAPSLRVSRLHEFL